tara:strand:+ start:1301 stop:2215 length:915 start_codon:yes stop_codon:yes gene_type:complete
MHKFYATTVIQVLILTTIGNLSAAGLVTCVKFLSEDLDPFVVAFFRCLIGLIIILPFVLHDKFKNLKTNKIKIHILRGIVNCISMFAWFTAVSLIPLEKATAIGFTTPLFATLFAVIFLKEIIKIHRTVALMIGFVGILIIIRPGYLNFEFGSYLMIVASISFAFVLIIIKQLSKHDSNFTIIFYSMAIMTPLTLLFAIPVWATPSLNELMIFLIMGSCGMISHICLIQSLKIADTTLVMPFQYLKLLWASIIGYFIFFEKPDLWIWLGGTIVFFAVVYITYREGIKKKKIEEKISYIRPGIDS